MARISAYHRPSTLAEALDLLHRPALRTVVLAGGTSVVPAKVDQPTEVVDLQALGLSGICVADDGRVVVGATTSLQDIADAPALPVVLREAARREQPSTLRTLATVGGVVVESGYARITNYLLAITNSQFPISNSQLLLTTNKIGRAHV